MFINHIKTAVLLATISGIFLGFGYLFGGTTGLTIGLIISVGINFVSYWFSDKMVLKIYKAQPLKRVDYPKVYEMLQELSQRYNIKPKYYTIPDNNPNAFATGRSKRHCAIAFTRGLLELMTLDEVKGVAAHEFAHIKNNDILISSIVAMIATAISYLAFFARFAAIFGGGDEDGGNGMELLVLSLLAPFLAFIIQATISRAREYIADATAARTLKTAEPLALALGKLQHNHTEMHLGNNRSAHLFIKNPFRARGFLNLLNTHPPLEERIAKLRSMTI